MSDQKGTPMTDVTAPEPPLDKLLRGCVADAAQVRTSLFDTRAAAHDASHVLLYPKAVVRPRDAGEVAKLLAAASSHGFGLTFRSGGTSLSGQAGTDQGLVDVRRCFQQITVLDDGARVRVQPGLTVDRVNAYLAPYGTKLGPDPASSRACTIGGVVANNSSGMACGTTENTYRTLDSLVAVLPSGTVIDTAAPDADDKLRLVEPGLYAALVGLRDRVRANPSSLAKIAQQFSMKNTMGYGVNAFADFDAVIDIFTHLLIGSEGTLAFIAEATFHTVPVRPHTATALAVFDDLYHATAALPQLIASGAATLELMDAGSLRVGQHMAGTPASIQRLDVTQQAALLVEYQAVHRDELDAMLPAARAALADLPVAQPVPLITGGAERDGLWAVRSGLHTLVTGERRPGTTALLEDVVVPVPALAPTCQELTGLFAQFGYDGAVIFGHAKDGNIHFMITDRFEDAALERYAGFTEAIVDVILGHDGSLKAEHGTGRIMAPFVARQYGDELYDVMRLVKQAFDPAGLLNDSVVITDDPQLHLRHIKAPVLFDPAFDRCCECGYCEPVCPARDLTLTPRQRIALRREAALAQQAGDEATARAIAHEYVYAGVQTCAVDGLCELACPLSINTANLVKGLRDKLAPRAASALWTTAARHWEATTSLASTAMDATHAAHALAPVIRGANTLGRAMLGDDNIPLWSPELPAGGAVRRRPAAEGTADAIYLPACVNRMFGPVAGDGVQAAFEALCAQAGVTLLVPEGIDELCCGTPWSSKSIRRGHDVMAAKVLARVRAVDNALPIVCDAASCTEGFAKILDEDEQLQGRVVDAVQFVADRVLPVLGDGYPRLESVTIHETCSSTKTGLNPALVRVAHAVADRVVVPVATGCCAFAGDRGMLHPELTASATRPEAAEVASVPTTAYASCNRTCELGLTRATGRPYRHILELLAEQMSL